MAAWVPLILRLTLFHPLSATDACARWEILFAIGYERVVFDGEEYLGRGR